ncbi:pyridoxal phosphate-dependent aminotransferase [Hespellia stercorisuis]|uniref:Aminotransferase n=1 Tax=Hespellia stercorisuis DSM 15480 TaxID=1121950 RepID=A0A1M6LZB4_9FIRM|nr:threonine-phosphate decarboxylase [Hespellia stercorisuis]SHJ76512.1 threonine-phosphate decarboxylase [Hespellia stercorisuis DSM 15480]
MNTKPAFHGSDLEAVSAYYHIPQASIRNFGSNVNPLGLSDAVRTALADNLDLISTYPDREYTSLRKCIGDYCSISPSHVIVGNGSTELIALLIEQRAPKHALIVGPTYSEYSRELDFVGGVQDYYLLRAEHDFSLDLDDLCSHLTANIDLLILCNPNNPTSSAVTQDQIRAILEHCRQKKIFVMIDETYAEFAPDVSAITAMSLVADYDNLMILRGISKFFAAPGLRLGYGATSNQTFLSRLKEHQNPWSLNSLGAFAGEQMLKDQEYIARTRRLILSERERLLQKLRSFQGVRAYDAAANFILIQITKKGLTASAVFEHCIKKGLMIRDCSSFEALNGEYVRFCILNPEDNDRLLAALQELF